MVYIAKIVILFPIFFCFVVYYVGRYYINKNYNINLPIIFERYYDNPVRTQLQTVLLIAGILLGGIIGFTIMTVFNLWDYI